MNDIQLTKKQGFWRGNFSAMASPCEVLMEVEKEALAQKILQIVSTEAKRIEQKFSRYDDNNIIAKINRAKGQTIEVDAETARLINFSDQLYQLSEGLFDITSGILRKAWKFDGSNNVPEQETIDKILPAIGWHRVKWQHQKISMLPDMQIDLGGVGKEYAVDRCVQLVKDITTESVLINFGGDLATTCGRQNNGFWSVGRYITGKDHSVAIFQLRKGAIATSGDAYRYLVKDGIRYSHVLNPKTGWPVDGAPHTVSIAAATCVEAGMLSTLTMLQGERAEEFLKLQEVNYWID